MYNYNFKENNESLINEETNINIKINQKYYVVNFVLTEKNILIFYDINRNNVLSSRLVQMVPQFELILKIKIDSIKYEMEEDNFILVIDDKRINCYDFDVNKFVDKKI